MNSSFKPKGSLHVIIGPMFCGKTTELIRLKTRSEIAGRKCLVIKYEGDTRYDPIQLSTHDMIKIPAVISHGKSLQKTLDGMDLSVYNGIYIDEIQVYMDGDVVCDQLANQGLEVVACGLQGDFQRKPYGCIPQLIALADKITHLTAIDAETGHEAPFTARLTQDQQQEVIGGAETYQAVDRCHYLRLNGK